MLRIMAVRPDHDPAAVSRSDAPADDDDLVDPLSGTTIRGGLLTAVVSARPEESAALADRLGRHGPGPHQTTWGGIRLDDLAISEVRRRIVVSEPDPRLFSGVLRDQLVGAAATVESGADAPVRRALDTASADDVLDALPDGLDGFVEERGRSYSGGQRQRLALARALLTEAPVLVLVEPTSAVDAHTEARIAGRLARHRQGRTTVVTTASPLLLGAADHVVLLEDGLATAQGTHRELLAHPAYRHVVLRGEEDDQ
jgi:ABC-type multidrug transport system fused ATPase/permease subunit